MDKIIQTPAIGFSVTANLGGTKQIVLQHFVDGTESPETINAAIDKIVLVATRQEAIADIPGLEKELAKLEKTLSRFEEDRATVDKDFAAKKDALAEQVKQLTAKSERIHSEAYDQQIASGRSFSGLAGSKRAEDNAVQSGIRQVKDQIDKLDAERAEYVKQLDVSKARYAEDIAQHKALIAEKRALI